MSYDGYLKKNIEWLEGHYENLLGMLRDIESNPGVLNCKSSEFHDAWRERFKTVTSSARAFIEARDRPPIGYISKKSLENIKESEKYSVINASPKKTEDRCIPIYDRPEITSDELYIAYIQGRADQREAQRETITVEIPNLKFEISE